MRGELNTDNTDATGFSQMAVATTPVLASQWELLPSRGTEAHSVLLLKASFAIEEGWGGSFFLFAKILHKFCALQDRAR